MADRLRVIRSEASLLDYSVVEKGIIDHSTEGRTRGVAFAYYVANTVFLIDKDEIYKHIVDGGSDRGIDILYIDYDRKIINFGSCKSVATFKKSKRNFPGDEVDKIISVIDDVFYRRDIAIEASNEFLSIKIREVWDILESDHFDVKVHLFSNQLTLAPGDRDRLTDALFRNRVELIEHGLYELSHGNIRASRPRFQKKIVPIHGNGFLVEEENRRGQTIRVTLTELFKFFRDPNELKFDDRLLHHNVRYFLGIDNDVNREIKETLLSGKGDSFWFLNNGLTIVCDQIISIPNGCHPITLINPQIVNGGQTARVIYDVGAETLVSLKEGSLNVKIVETRDSEFINRIALASNTQSRIYGRDLRANDDIQKKIALSLERYGIFYQRRRGDERPKNLVKSFDAAKVGQIILSFYHADPSKSKTDSNKIFEEYYYLTFDQTKITAEIIMAAIEVYEIVEGLRNKALQWQKSISRKSFSEDWIIEGHYHVIFVVGELKRRKGDPLDSKELAEEYVEKAMEIVAEFVRRNQSVPAYRLFRLSSSKEALLSLLDRKLPHSASHPTQLELHLDSDR